MKKSLFLIFALVSFSVLSQSIWTKGNAVWHYQLSNLHEFGFVKVWENGDTMILGQQCTRLKAERHSLMLIGPGAGTWEFVTDYIGGAIYTSNDTVYYWDTDHFSVLYDFSAQANDQWLLQIGGTPDFSCNDTSVCIVQSVGTTTIDGQNHTELTLGHASDAAFYLEGKANSRFGSSEGYLFPLGRTCDGSENGWEDQLVFVCFEDDSLYYNPTGGPCRYYLGLNESESKTVSIFPNPASGHIILTSDEVISGVICYNVLGESCLKRELNSLSAEIDLPDLENGICLLEINTKTGKQLFQRIYVER